MALLREELLSAEATKKSAAELDVGLEDAIDTTAEPKELNEDLKPEDIGLRAPEKSKIENLPK